MMTWRDPLAGQLWESREQARAVPAEATGLGLPLERATAIAEELYDRERGLSPQIGWKLGATDSETQQRLGTDGPFHAPLFARTRLAPGAVISMARFLSPRVEAEIAVEVDGTRRYTRPCVEIIDCRFPSWPTRLADAIADFGLHAAVLFADDHADAPAADVRVCRDRNELARGTRTIGEALDAVSALAPRLDGGLAVDGARSVIIATGSVTPPVPLAPGRWTISFGRLGVLAFEVVP
ncbi:MAG: hypothetical protein ABIZ57_04740 [Candidatus Limnocylindria bacterium]